MWLVRTMDKYERIRVVGRGAFGTVYLCRRLRDHREVIVKQGQIADLDTAFLPAAKPRRSMDHNLVVGGGGGVVVVFCLLGKFCQNFISKEE